MSVQRMRSEFTTGGGYWNGGVWDVRDTGKSIEAVLVSPATIDTPLTGRIRAGETVKISPRMHAVDRVPRGAIAVHPFRGGGLHWFEPEEAQP